MVLWITVIFNNEKKCQTFIARFNFKSKIKILNKKKNTRKIRKLK